MSDVLEVMCREPNFQRDEAITKLEEPLKKDWIKQRKVGGNTLDYIEGTRVIEILNQAFSYQWSFEIISYKLIEAEPWKNQEQGKYALLIGQLTVPGLGVKQAPGTKTVIGRTDTQESVFKAAMTDSLKKCATLFGIGKELYLDEPVSTNNTSSQSSKSFDPKDVQRLKEIKAILGVKENKDLNQYVGEWSGEKINNYNDITPGNIKAFNAWLENNKVSKN